MFKQKLLFILTTCFINALMVQSSSSNVSKYLNQSFIKDESFTKVLAIVNMANGEFDPFFDLSKEIYNQGAKVDFALFNRNHANNQGMIEKMESIDAKYTMFDIDDQESDRQRQAIKYFTAEQFLYHYNLPYEKFDVENFAKTVLKNQDDIIKYFYAASAKWSPEERGFYEPMFTYFMNYDFGIYVENVLMKDKKYDLIISDFLNLFAADAAYKQKIPYIAFFPQLNPSQDIGKISETTKISIKNLKDVNLNYSAKLLEDVIEGAKESVFSSFDNQLCNMSYSQISKKPCKNYLKSVLASWPLYWRTSIEISSDAKYVDEMMGNLKNQIWVGNRNFPYSRNPDTDPESWAPMKQNPFDSKHPPRIYMSLGSSFNNKPEIWKSVLKVMNEKQYPTICGCGGNEELSKTLSQFKEDFSWEYIEVQSWANQREILANSDLYFCHGGASSTYEGMYFEVPVLMLPQEAPDQLPNSLMMEKFKAGLLVDQSEVYTNPSGFQSEVQNKIEKQLVNFKDYKNVMSSMSKSMKESNTYEDVAKILLKDVEEGGDSLIIKEKLPEKLINGVYQDDQ